MKRAFSMALAVTLAVASFAPIAVAAPRCIMDTCCPKGTNAYDKKPRLVSNWTSATPCCKPAGVDTLKCEGRVPIKKKM